MDWTTLLTDLSGIGIAIGKFVSRHMIICTYEFPLELGGYRHKGPERSHVIKSNRFYVVLCEHKSMTILEGCAAS